MLRWFDRVFGKLGDTGILGLVIPFVLRPLDWLFGKSTKTYVTIFAVLGAVGFIGNIVTNHRIPYVIPPDVLYYISIHEHLLFWSYTWVGLNLILYTALNGAIWGGIFAAIAALYRALRGTTD